MRKINVTPSPKERYEKDLAQGKLRPDAAQANAIEELESLYQQLKQATNEPVSYWKKWFHREAKEGRVGVYLWGGVGRGKSYLMGLFFESLSFFPEAQKSRIHFNRFMEKVHADLRLLQGEKDPLKELAKTMASKLKILCFDEFFVEDIADAMILGKLFGYLFEEGLSWVATSNCAPEKLYWDGLKRDQFLPAIKQIQVHSTVVCVDSGIDYRENQSFDHEIRYLFPLSQQEKFLTQHFEHLKAKFDEEELPVKVKILDRSIQAIRRTSSVFWIDCSELCKSPRGKADYIELVNQYQAILVSSVPIFTPSIDDQARRFIAFVDEVYDHGVELIIGAEASPESLYQGERYQFTFERTASRLKTLKV
jgi:cell division protein ZapE